MVGNKGDEASGANEGGGTVDFVPNGRLLGVGGSPAHNEDFVTAV